MRLEEALREYRDGRLNESAILDFLRAYPTLDLGDIRLDRHRSLRKGFPEVVFGQGKTPNQLRRILAASRDETDKLLITRLAEETFTELEKDFPRLRYLAAARCAYIGEDTPQSAAPEGPFILALGAGTTDAPVVEEAALTARLMGCRVEILHDMGVAGLHRLLEKTELLQAASVVVVAAGMDAALPGVVTGLVMAPVIAVPTSVGYGASFQGLAALLSMLNTCAPGQTVVNIDNGFGAGYAAAQILWMARRQAPPQR